MKRIAMFIMIAAFTAVVACSDDTAEIGWENNVDANINEIVWEKDETTWVKGDILDEFSGYEKGEITEKKGVEPGTSSVSAAFWDGHGYRSDTAILGSGDSSYKIKEGDSVIVSIDYIKNM